MRCKINNFIGFSYMNIVVVAKLLVKELWLPTS